MSNYTRDSYRRRRQEEQLMFQRIVAEEAQIQNFLLLQHDGGVTEFIGGEIPTPIPSEITTRFYAYNDGVTTTNFTQLNYFDVKDALEYSNQAITKSKKSYTIHLINALIYSQTFGYGHWCRKYQVMEKVRTNSSLILDFKAEGTKIIFDYINGYKKYCSPFSKFKSK